MTPELSIIIPTYKERQNVPLLIEKLRVVLQGISWEAVFVDDDSPDKTWEVVFSLAEKDSKIRGIRRIGRRGLSSAAIEGMLSSSAPFLAVMDADLQHDEKILPVMLAALKQENLDMVVGSRYVNGGGMENWSKERIAASRSATRFAQILTGIPVQDPMSGFFMVRRRYFENCVHRLNGKGFKILLDLLMSSDAPPLFKEIPFTFRLRQHGESKLSFKVIADYFHLVFEKALRRSRLLRVACLLCLSFFVMAVIYGLFQFFY